MKRMATWAAAVVVPTLTLTGCPVDSDAEPQPPDSPVAQTPEEVAPAVSGDLTVWIMDPGSREVRATLDELGAAFEAAHEDVRVTIEYVPWIEAHEHFTAAVAGGQVPDLAEMGNTMTPVFAEDGVLAAVEFPAELRFVEGLADAATIDGVTYGYPWYAGARALIYRSDVLEEAGAGVPATWAEMVEVGELIAAEVEGIAPVQVGGGYQHMQQPLIWGAGGEIATRVDDTWQPGFQSEAGREAFGLFQALWEKGWSPPAAVEWGSAELRDAFVSEQSAMMIGGGWDLRRVLEANPDLDGRVGTALMPAGPAGSSDVVAGGSHLVVFEDSAQQELARMFAEYLVAPEHAQLFAEQVGFLPGTVEGVEMAVGDDELLATFGEQLVEHSRAYPAAGWWRPVENEVVIPRVFQRLMREELGVDEALAEVDAAIEDAVG